ncbi:MAG TPA: single-stranded-DNA-specific exonuclease RecJ [Thermodesulfovibrionales bacterium]|nr:single-stranded-DNA-specific exonuclease RecJ [Thermodesulfovibrionales bacterium]
MKRRWFITKTNPEYVRYLSLAASISPLLAQILINRGVKTADDINTFLNPGITGLSDPFELPGMRVAVDRIKAASRLRERVLIHGDYDTDGLTSAAIMIYALKTIGMDVHCFIPNRMVHGYGFNAPSVDVAKKLGVKLIITVDCGITSIDAATRAKSEGIDVIITDHHEPVRKTQACGLRAELHDEFLLPDAVAIVNPKLTAPRKPFADLSGAGVAFKIVQAMAIDPDLSLGPEASLSLLDLAALGTIADVVPLVGENRVIIKEGLRCIGSAYRPGIRALMEVSGLGKKEMKAGLLSFTMVPRINAAGRIGDAGDVISLFLSGSDEETLSIAGRLDRINTERQRIEEGVYQEALSQLQAEGHDAAIVLQNEGWHTGVIGIVASRLAEEFYRPAFIFTVDDTVAKGSIRSIPGFDVYDGLSQCGDLLIAFGGHKQAAGVKLSVSNLPAFRERMNRIVTDFLKREDITPTLEIDAEVALSEVNAGLVRELSLLEPLGYGNPEPLFGSRRLGVLNPRVVGNNHIKMKLGQKSSSLDAIGFDMGKSFESLCAKTVDVVFTPMINEWNGGRYLQLHLKAFRASV